MSAEKLVSSLVYEVDDGSITTDKLADKAVTTGKLADGAVTADKINSTLKSSAIADLDGTANLADVITAINSILAVLRTAGIIASS